jgi:methylase of polypeptide subunit release factors
VVELGAGAGQIGLLAVSLEPRRLVCVDSSSAACELASRNAAAAGLGDLVEVREGGLEEVLGTEERFALVIADPPWVPTAEVGRHPDDPPPAIDGGEDGLDVARICLRVAERHLLPDGSVLLQLGTDDQARRLAAEWPALALVEVRVGEGGVVARFTAA